MVNVSPFDLQPRAAPSRLERNTPINLLPGSMPATAIFVQKRQTDLG